MNHVVDHPLEPLTRAMFRPMGVDGVYARTGPYEEVIEGLSGLISRHRERDTEILRFPPLMSRQQLEKSGYLNSFPQLLGTVSCLHGREAEIRGAVERFNANGNWTSALAATDLVLSPAACYPLYPLVADRGSVPGNGLLFDVACDCFRREPAKDPDRLQSFRMREYVCIGTAEQAMAFRGRWLSRAKVLANLLQLRYRVAPASDPFFGREGRLLAASQVEQSLKFELLVPVRSEASPTACMSFNYHRDHFGTVWDMRNEAGELAHTACVAFGLDRLAIALFGSHGVELRHWPGPVRQALRL